MQSKHLWLNIKTFVQTLNKIIFILISIIIIISINHNWDQIKIKEVYGAALNTRKESVIQNPMDKELHTLKLANANKHCANVFLAHKGANHFICCRYIYISKRKDGQNGKKYKKIVLILFTLWISLQDRH